MASSQDMGILSLLKRATLTYLAAGGEATAPPSRPVDYANIPGACPMWPLQDYLTHDPTSGCHMRLDYPQALDQRQSRENHEHLVSGEILRAEAVEIFSHRCVSDEMSMRSAFADFASESWRARPKDGAYPSPNLTVFGGDSVFLGSELGPYTLPKAEDLKRATEHIWRESRIAFFGTNHGAESQMVLERWAVSSDFPDRAILLIEGLPAGPLSPRLVLLRHYSGGIYLSPRQKLAIVDFIRRRARPVPRLLGLEDPRLSAASHLFKYVRHLVGQQDYWKESDVTEYLSFNESLLSAWQAAFATTSAEPQRLSAELSALRQRPHDLITRSRYFLDRVAQALESEDGGAAAALGCLASALAQVNGPQAKARIDHLVMRPRERAWMQEIWRAVGRDPEAPLLVICGEAHVPSLRASAHQLGLTSWASRPKGAPPREDLAQVGWP